ncbi:hypothetical protein [Mesorhizobium sp. M1409]|uniref:hypothetical protein n=1 Tax=unclassified Mesorhizobium TaxID=325217 RepID=UPI00333B9E0E
MRGRFLVTALRCGSNAVNRKRRDNRAKMVDQKSTEDAVAGYKGLLPGDVKKRAGLYEPCPRENERLGEGLLETFPASDPLASGRFD